MFRADAGGQSTKVLNRRGSLQLQQVPWSMDALLFAAQLTVVAPIAEVAAVAAVAGPDGAPIAADLAQPAAGTPLFAKRAF